MLHRCETSMTKLQCGEKGKKEKKSQLSCHFLYICHAKQYLGMSGHDFHFVVTDMAKVRNV